MRARFGRWVVWIALCVPLFAQATGGARPAETALPDGMPLAQHDAAVAAYRAGDWESARTAWSAALELSRGERGLDRAALCYNLGNVAYRQGDELAAVAWYTSALALAPRFAAARENRDLVRRTAGLEASDRGDLEGTLSGALRALTPAEAEWLALCALVLTALALGYEAVCGGALGRRLVASALVLLALGLLPWLYRLTFDPRDPYMIVAPTGARVHAEPREDATVTGELAAGGTVERLDAWPGWLRVETGDGERGWIAARHAQSLRP